MMNTGKIIVLAFPDTFVTMSDEWICKLLPLVGLGTQQYIKAGHAAMVLVNNANGNAQYYDFGRYGTQRGHGRVRSSTTDAELEIPFQLRIDAQDHVSNIEELLLWLEAHPEKTRGKGRLLASICDCIDYNKAQNFIDSLIEKGSIPYGAFDKNGSNCSRFVADTLLASTSNKKIRRHLLFNKLFTPSTVGNVEKAACCHGVFEVQNGVVAAFKGSALKENLKNYFHRKKKTAHPLVELKGPAGYLYTLESIGSTHYFEFCEADLPPYHFRIKRYNELFVEDFDGVYYSEDFNENIPFRLLHDSHCAQCRVLQSDLTIQLTRVDTFSAFISRSSKASVQIA